MLANFFRSDPAASGLNLNQPSIDWDQFLSHASAEEILPALAKQVETLGLRSRIPTEINEVFAAAESLNGERNQIVIAESLHAARLLNEIGIQPVALKGLAYLLCGVYPDPATRYLVDIDLLVPASQLPGAVRQLHASGYFENQSSHFPFFRQHHPPLRRAGLPQIELHHQVGLGVCDRLLPVSNLFRDARSIQVKGAKFIVPSPTDLAIHLILHSQLHHNYINRIFPPLRALVDLSRLSAHFGTSINWEQIDATFRAAHQSATLILHLHQAHDIVGFKIPAPIPKKLPFFLSLRYKRRRFLDRHPRLRFADPCFLLMSILGRRLRLIPDILRNPSTWRHLLRALIDPAFYRKLFVS